MFAPISYKILLPEPNSSNHLIVSGSLENKVLTIWGIGGNYKKNSSSWILEKWEK